MNDILREFGPDSPDRQVARAKNGGEMPVKAIPYSPPKGPTSQMQEGVSLHGTNHGCCGTQGRH